MFTSSPTIDFSIVAVFVSLASFTVLGFTTLHNISSDGKRFRLEFMILWFLTLISVFAVFFAVKPLEIAIFGVLILTATASTFLMLLVRQHYKTTFLKDDDISQSGRINQLHNTEANYILSCIINKIDTSSLSVVPARAQSLGLHLSNFHEAFKAATRNIEFRFSILETLDDGTFEIAYVASSFNFDTQAQMKQSFRWKGTTISGCAGQCAASNTFVLCNDIQDDEERKNSHWVPLAPTNQKVSEQGCILCVPIPYPQSYQSSDRTGECLGVLSITCSKPNYLREAHARWIQKWYIDALINVILLYKLDARVSKIL